MTSRDDINREYENLKNKYKNTHWNEFKTGNWFIDLIQWILGNYAEMVDAKYIVRKYPGASPDLRSQKVIKLASRYNAIAGGISAGAITAAEVATIGSGGSSSPITVPSIALSIIGDVCYTTRTQLRAAYDLSVVYEAPLAVDDVEDCYFIFMTSLGIKSTETLAETGKVVGPQIVSYNVRKLLRSGLRKTLQELLRKIGGAKLAEKLTERAMMRLLVPGISVPIASTANYLFTNKILKNARKQMARRGGIVSPLTRLYSKEPDLDQKFAVKALITVLEIRDSEGWSENQINCLRYCQSVLQLNDSQIADLDIYFDRRFEGFVEEIPIIQKSSSEHLFEFLTFASGMTKKKENDMKYAESIVNIIAATGNTKTVNNTIKNIREHRNKYL